MNGAQGTIMPGWQLPDLQTWQLVTFIRSLPPTAPAEAVKAEGQQSVAGAHYVGSAACQQCHAAIYDSWKKTIALVYGSKWKQRYFAKVGQDYFPFPAQWDVAHKMWRAYFVKDDWWAPYYPPDNFKRPTGPTCDGCHSVNYDISTKTVTEWNVGCERCHGPGREHVKKPGTANIINPARLNYVQANDTCIQCHSQGRPLTSPIEGQYYDWPVGFQMGLKLSDIGSWRRTN